MNSAWRWLCRWATSVRLASWGWGLFGQQLDALGEVGEHREASPALWQVPGVEGGLQDVGHRLGGVTRL